MVAAAAATSILSLCSSPAFADSDAGGAAKGSPGVLSGNNVQVPVEAPVNACGNTVDVVALLNPAFGNSCANGSGSGKSAPHQEAYGGDDSGYGSGYGSDHGDDDSGYGSGDHGPSGSSAHGETGHSPGVGSGNNAEAPVDVPVNACGDTVDVISGLNPAFGDDCGGGYGDQTPPPPHGDEHPTPPPHGDDHPSPPPHGDEHPSPPPPHGDEHPSPPPTQPDQPTPPGPHGSPPQLAHSGSGSAALLGMSGASAALIAGGAVLYRRGRAASRR